MAPSPVSSNMKRLAAFSISIFTMIILFHALDPSALSISVHQMHAAGNRVVNFFRHRRAFALKDVYFVVNETVTTAIPLDNNLTEPLRKTQIKRIFLASNLFGRGHKSWEMYFPIWNSYKVCSCDAVYSCQWTRDSSEADALVFHGREVDSVPQKLLMNRKLSQRWVFFSWESIIHAQIPRLDFWYNKFNWTATYMRNSNVWTPYYRGYVKLDEVTQELYKPSEKINFSFAVISNCGSKPRQDLVHSLSRHMTVDVYGKCGRPLELGRNAIIKLSRKYRFYLALENSLCRDYITEKFWGNGLNGNAVPVVFGGINRTDYDEVAPPKSFIYARDFSSKSNLALFLKRLAKNEKEYSSYFEWKRRYKVDTYSMKDTMMCGLCKQLHTDNRPSTVDLKSFWSVKKNCVVKDG